MFEFLKKIKRDKLYTSLKNNAKKNLISYNSIKSVGFAYIIDSTSACSDLIDISAKLNKIGILYKGVIIELKNGLIDKSGIENMLLENNLGRENFLFIKKKDINFIGIPSSAELKDYFKSRYDIFICFNSIRNFTLDYLTLKTDSLFSIGKQESWYPIYTLVIKGDNKVLLNDIDFIEQIFHYLKVIKPND